jgi:ribosomal protein L16 Arg81 hydroxylase
MARSTPLERLLAPLSVDEFVGEYFQRTPLRIRGKPGKFDFLFRAEEFQLGLDRVSEIRAVFPRQWQAQIRAADLKQMMHAGATVCVTGLDDAHPRLSRAARLIRSQLNYPGEVSFRAYLSPPGRGFDLHFDARVATTLQIAGTKRWWFSTKPAVAFPLYNSGREPPGFKAEYKVPKVSTLRSVLLRPGDLLCLPAGVWHRAKAGTMSLALNMAFDHCGAGVLDSITSMLQQSLVSSAKWREPLPVTPNASRQKIPRPVKAILSARIDALRDELSKIREDETALRKLWQRAIESKPV